MLKGWALKYHDRYCIYEILYYGYFIVVTFEFTNSCGTIKFFLFFFKEFTKIPTLLLTLQEPANDDYTCTVVTSQVATT